MNSEDNKKLKIIKRYQNRKLYDTQQSCYVTLDDIAKMIRNNEEVKVIDNKTKNDITASTLTQIVFESEKKSFSICTSIYFERDHTACQWKYFQLPCKTWCLSQRVHREIRSTLNLQYHQ